ncbi:hypothetical protein O1R50_13230 [Glycomyces luteolus]|uniref:Secreted protein n=1 Tax=Glycomyces luteolus TaxID=2670330 RepID=A0A9X3PBP1_9ACTN|nr:hypothetical protein [Glycomyces luteolus]MDA1360593.1 hypothetical protein [Glycomyces luteolus]
MTRSVSRRNLFKIGGGVAVAGVGASVAFTAHAQDVEPAQALHSSLVYPGADGKLNYALEEQSDRKIPNFSWAGYRNGEAPIPTAETVPAAVELEPIPGETDATVRINAALAEVAAKPKDANGFKGALLLHPGLYPVAETIELKYSGVILRGSGRTGDPAVSTIIRSTAKAGTENELTGVECPIKIGSDDMGVKWETMPDGTAPVPIPITSELVTAGSRRFAIESTAGLAVGDNIIIWHPCTSDWIDAIDGGGVTARPPWEPDKHPIMYNRFIKAIPTENEILIDAPVFNDLNFDLSKSYVYKWSNPNEVVNAGVENLRVDMGLLAEETKEEQENEKHADSCIVVSRSRDTWVRNVSTLHFKRSGVMVRRSHRVTVDDVWARDPRSRPVGGMRYNFCAGYMAQQVLFTNVWASQARHAFVAGGGASTSGVVWLDSRSNNGLKESGGHAHWSQGLLFDNVREETSESDRDEVLNLHNREDGGADESADAHGWSSVYSVLWNCTVGDGKDGFGRQACVQQPPTSQNFAIGTKGTGVKDTDGVVRVVSGESWIVTEPIGFVEHTNKNVEPASLYRKQLADRLAP